MRPSAEEQMTELIHSCLSSLGEIEAAFIRDCWLEEPRVSLGEFSKERHMSGKELTELRARVLLRLRNLLAEKNIHSVVDIV
jgi:hypothetical protein